MKVSTFTNTESESNLMYKRLTYKKRKSNKFEWCKIIADQIAGASNYRNKKRDEKFKLNYNLYNGKGREEDFNDYITKSMVGDIGVKKVRHYDIISSIASSMVGDQAKRLFEPLCLDVSSAAANDIKRRRLELIQDYIKQKIIDPIRQEVESQIQIDPNDPEAAQQAQQQIEQQVQAMTPEEIHNYMRKSYKGQGSVSGQKILSWIIKELKLKFLFDQGFKNLIVTGMPIFYGTVVNGLPHAELVEPSGFDYGGIGDNFFIEDAEWWRREKQITVSEAYRLFGAELNKEDREKLDNYATSYSPMSKAVEDTRLIREVELNPKLGEINILTKEGQNQALSLYASSNLNINGDTPITMIHCVWKSPTLFKYVTRLGDDGEQSGEYYGEDYELNPLAGDIEEKEIWLPQIWETTILSFGSRENNIYLKTQPIPNQYASLDDPFKVKGPYHGISWGTFFGITDSIAPLDKAKPSQYDYNVIKSKVNEIIATDKGKLMLFAANAIPEKYTMEQFIELISSEGLVPIDTNELRQVDPQIFKTIDMSKVSDLKAKLEYLEYIKQEAIHQMSYNPSRLGQVSPYMTATNNQQNIMQSLSQTEDLYSMYNTIQENFMTYMVHLAKSAYIQNPKSLVYVLDDFSLAELNIDIDTLSLAKLNVYISNNSNDVDNLNFTRSHIQMMIQNQLISFPEAIKTQWSKSGIEMLDIAEQAEERRQQENERKMQHEREMLDKQQAAQQEAMEADRNFQLMKLKMELDNKIEIAKFDSLKYANQYDIDQDQMNDNYEIELAKIEAQSKENEKNRDLDLEKQKKELEFKIQELNKKIELEKQKLKSK